MLVAWLLLCSSQARDHFFLMGRDDNNEPTKLAEFDDKMLTMRQSGFSPHKHKLGFKIKPATPTKSVAKGHLGKGARNDKGEESTDLERSTRRVTESAKKVLQSTSEPEDEVADGEDFGNQVAALLSLVEMGKKE